MREVTIKIYEFNELSEKAKINALNNVRSFCYACNSKSDWESVSDAINVIEELAEVSFDIQSSSQGCYVNYYRDFKSYNDMEECERYHQFKNDVKERSFDDCKWYGELKDLILKTDIEPGQDFVTCLGHILEKFCDSVNNSTIAYFEDDCTEDFIKANDYEFLEDGTLFGHVIH